MSNGGRLVSTGNLAVVVSASDATNPRKDIVYVKSDSTIGYLAGTPASSPIAPIVPTGAFLLAEINVLANASSITNANIVDRRRIKNTTDNLSNKIGDLTTLTTTDKTSVVNAIKENTASLSENTQNISKLKSVPRANKVYFEVGDS